MAVERTFLFGALPTLTVSGFMSPRQNTKYKIYKYIIKYKILAVRTAAVEMATLYHRCNAPSQFERKLAVILNLII